jgi:hypothetical protein
MTQEENGTSKSIENEVVENKDPTARAEVVETIGEEPKEAAGEAKGLSLRDSLEVALIASNDGGKPVIEHDKGLEVAYKGKRQPAQKVETPKAETPKYQPPAEYNREEREDFLALSPKQQEAALRLHRSRMSTLEDIKRHSAELSTYRKLSEDVEPFIKAMGIKDSSPVAIQKAIQMWHDFEKAEDPREAAANYLRAKGREDAIPESWLEGQEDKKVTAQNSALQEELNQIKLRLAREDHQRALQPVVEALHDFESQKNAAGKPKYPSFRSDDTSEEGLKFASSFGSLVNGKTDFSKEFIARTQARIPNLTVSKLYEEAYKFAGGIVDEAEAPRTQATQKQIQKSNRAAASMPGNGISSASSGKVIKYKTTREALAAALAQLGEEG